MEGNHFHWADSRRDVIPEVETCITNVHQKQPPPIQTQSVTKPPPPSKTKASVQILAPHELPKRAHLSQAPPASMAQPQNNEIIIELNSTKKALEEAQKELQRMHEELDSLHEELDTTHTRHQDQVESLLAEKSRLRDQVLQTQALQKDVTTPSSNIKRMMARSAAHEAPEVCIQGCHSMSDKAELLEGAVHCGDDNALMIVIFFLKDTLRPSPFQNLLMKHKRAVGAWRRYLVELGTRDSLEMLANLYLGHKDWLNGGMVLLKRANMHQDAPTRITALDACASFFRGHKFDFHAKQVEDQSSLLKRQIPIEIYDSKVEREKKDAVYEKYPRPGTIIGGSLTQTLRYCLFYHPDAPKDKKSSPVGMRKEYDIADKCYLLQSIRARAKIGDWESVKKLAVNKSILGKKFKSVVGFKPFVQILVLNKAPRDYVKFFIELVDDDFERFHLALKHDFPHIAVQASVKLGSKTRLIEYKQYLMDSLGGEGSEEARNLIDSTLSNEKIKWK